MSTLSEENKIEGRKQDPFENKVLTGIIDENEYSTVHGFDFA